MGDRCSRKENKIRKGLCRRLGSLLLCIAMFLPLLCVDASADQTFDELFPDLGDVLENDSYGYDAGRDSGAGKALENAYLLQVSSGTETTDQVLYFEVRYQGTDGLAHSQIIFPGYDAQHKGIDLAKAALGDNNSMQRSTAFLSAMRYFKTEDSSKSGFLPSEKTQSYFFYPEYELKTVTGLNLFATYKEGSGNNEWGCQDISLYRVETLYDVAYFGEFSDEVYFSFSGKLMASLDSGFQDQGAYKGYANGCTFKWTGDRQFRLGRDVIPGSAELTLNIYDEKTGGQEYDTTAGDYLVQLDICDEYMRGLENLAMPYGIGGDKLNCSSLQYPLREQMTLDITYCTEQGVRREIHAPVVLNSLLYYDGTVYGGILNKSFVGYMQQGERVVFPVKLPGLAPRHGAGEGDSGIESIKLSFGKQLAEQQANLNAYRMDPGEDQDFGIQGFRMYNQKDNPVCTVQVADGFVLPEITGDPAYIFTTDAPSGYTINYGTQTSIPYRAYSAGEDLTGRRNTGFTYLVTLQTGDPANAGTIGELAVSLNYKDLKGASRTTGIVSLREASSRYFGYWPGVGNAGDLAYEAGVAAGGKVSFEVEIDDLDYFTGINISLDQMCGDDWQLENITIQELLSRGKRKATWEKVEREHRIISDRRFTRENVCGADIETEFAADQVLYFQPGDTKTILFKADEVISGAQVINNDVDWSDIRYSMSFSDAKQNFGFTKARATYSVAVNVSSSVISGLNEDDCGSKNQFYFQLIFQNGCSAYVLANQQLGADGFRTGSTETFTINTNQDYGSVTAVRVIPEDVTEKSNLFDKLKIESIEITQQTDSEISKTWKAVVDDWVSIDYQDEGARNSMGGQEGRTENELARTYLISEEGYAVNVEVKLNTYAFDAGDGQGEPIKGRIKGELLYLDNKNNVRSEEFDLVSSLCDYTGRAKRPIDYVSEYGEFTVENCTEIDRSCMLRPGHADRFNLYLANAKQILQMNLTVFSVTAGRWIIPSAEIYRVLGDGTLKINKNDEYEKTYAMELLCTSAMENYDLQLMANNSAQTQGIGFKSNEIKVDMKKSGGWVSKVTHEPQSRNDTLNIYAYVRGPEAPANASMERYDLQGTAEYSFSQIEEKDADGNTRTVAGGHYAVSFDLEKDVSRNMFYQKNVRASGISTLDSLNLRADSFDSIFSEVDYAVVEQVRSGVVINTYCIDFGYANCGQSGGVSATLAAARPMAEEKQTVVFTVADTSPEQKLRKDVDDLAVCIRYTNSNDPAGEIVSSPYLFLTEQGFSALKPGGIIELNFRQHDVQDIVGITLVSTSQMEDLRVESACAASYQKGAEDHWSLLNWYSFGEPLLDGVDMSPRTMSLTGTSSESADMKPGTETKTVGLITIGLTTNDANGLGSTGTAAPMRVKISYDDDYGNPRFKELDNMHRYVIGGDMKNGSTIEIQTLLTGIRALRSIEIQPVGSPGDQESTVWGIQKITVDTLINGQSGKIERSVNKYATQDEPLLIGVANIRLDVAADIERLHSDKVDRRNFSSLQSEEDRRKAGGIMLQALYGDDGRLECPKLKLTPQLSNSLEDMTVTCNAIKLSADGTVMLGADCTEELLAISGRSGKTAAVTFDPMGGSGGIRLGTYLIRFASVENPELSVEITVTVDLEEMAKTALPAGNTVSADEAETPAAADGLTPPDESAVPEE